MSARWRDRATEQARTILTKHKKRTLAAEARKKAVAAANAADLDVRYAKGRLILFRMVDGQEVEVKTDEVILKS